MRVLTVGRLQSISQQGLTRFSSATYGAVDWPEGHEALDVMGQGAAEGLPVGVLAPLKDELLALEVMVLETHPAVEGDGRRQAVARERSHRG